MSRLRQPFHLSIRARRSLSADGFTLIELLLVVAIMAVLVAIAVGALVGFKNRALESSAQANLRAAMPAVAAYQDETGSFAGMTRTTLLAFDNGLAPGLTVLSATSSAYCLRSRLDLVDYYKSGPNGPIETTPCS